MNRRRDTKYVVWHCSATRPNQDIGAERIREWHLSRGWADIGYHLVIRRDGSIETGRPLDVVGSHAAGYNASSVGICLVGGLDDEGKSHASRPDLFTEAQWVSARLVYELMRRIYRGAQHVGHRDLSPDKNGDQKIDSRDWLKLCPTFDVAQELVAP
jgi:N-acetylmuramoyl-L-alanine amidase